MDEEKGIQEVYEDRNLLAIGIITALKNKDVEVGWRKDPEEPGWAVIYANTVYGQISWHIPQKDMPVQIPRGFLEYDGHTREEKNRRLEKIIDYYFCNFERPDEK